MKIYGQTEIPERTPEEEANFRKQFEKLAQERKAKEIASGKWGCQAPDCDRQDDRRYWMYEGSRYCGVHIWRLQKYNSTELPETITKLREMPKKCHAPGCEVSGDDKKYSLHENVRYCRKHHYRLKKFGSIELPSKVKAI